MSQSTIITTGFGTFGDVNLIPTLGFGGAVAAAEPRGVIVRRGKTILWPEWQQEQEALAEEARITREMEIARGQRDRLVAQLRITKETTSLVAERDRITRLILDTRQRWKAEIRRLERERAATRHKRIQFSARLKEIREEQEAEDLKAIAFIIGEFYE